MPQEFKTQLEVTAYLDKEGWKISNPTLSRHIKDGRLRPNKDGVFPLKTVKKYATDHLERIDTLQNVADDALVRQERKARIAKLIEEAKHARIRREEAEGKLISREQFYMELAARAVVLETGIKGEFQMSAGILIDIARHQTAGDFVKALNEIFDKSIHDFATTKEFQVIFEIGEKDEDQITIN